MKATAYNIIEAIQLLDPARNADKFESLGVRLTNGETLFIKDLIVEGIVLYAKAESREAYHMIPVEAVVSYEVERKKNPWFNDVKNLPAILAKLSDEKKKAA